MVKVDIVSLPKILENGAPITRLLAMKAYSRRLKEERIFQSMSRKGNCYDNSVMESFFGLLKQEIYYGVVYYSYEELKSEIERYIKYYNNERIKERLGWMSPVEYRRSFLAAQKQRSSH